MNNEYLRGFFNGLLVFFFGYNLITAIFFIFDGLDARTVSQTYTIIEEQFSIIAMGILFLLSAIVGIIAYFKHDSNAFKLMVLSSAINFGLMMYYGYTLLTVETLTVIAYRYMYIAIVHLAMVIGGVNLWRKKMKSSSQKMN